MGMYRLTSMMGIDTTVKYSTQKSAWAILHDARMTCAVLTILAMMSSAVCGRRHVAQMTAVEVHRGGIRRANTG